MQEINSPYEVNHSNMYLVTVYYIQLPENVYSHIAKALKDENVQQ